MTTNSGQMFGYLIGLLVTTGTVCIVFLWIYFLLKARMLRIESKSKERIALIEKGADPSILYRKEKGDVQDPLLWGFLLMGMGMGILIGYILHIITGWNQYVITNAMTFLLGGAGLVTYHFYRRKIDAKNQV